MTSTVGAYEARTRFAELLEQVQAGRTITITRRGQPVAELAPPGSGRRAEARSAAEAALARLRRGRVRFDADPAAIREAIRQGRP
ncbi:MAG: type II toxin-antitoxin system prevent-host-death family antitoxin [Bifidobacteriaceae bacterium]|jgi:prevent-host-death family protein|nr:type II toxin-antitoxin system prevent-host-death family antitoxin [Bifidobacteriaceae bacterium]